MLTWSKHFSLLLSNRWTYRARGRVLNQNKMETLGMMEPYDADVFNCSALVLPNNTVCLEHPEEMLKPWKTHPMFFEIIVIHVIIFVFGVVGNVVVIIVMAGDRKSRSATNFFLVSLAVGDLLMLCVYGPLETYTHFVIKWDETGAICKTAKFAEFVSATSSVLNLLAVTVERWVLHHNQSLLSYLVQLKLSLFRLASERLTPCIINQAQ